VAAESATLVSVGLGLASAVSWGAGDFSGGLASRRASAHGVVVISQCVGIVLLVGLAVVIGETPPPTGKLVWAALAGVGGAGGLLGLYRALAIGQMGIAAPVSAVVGAIVPVLAGAVSEGPPGTLRVLGFGLALTAVWLLAAPGPTGRSLGARGLALPAAAGVGFGLFLVLIHQVGGSAVLWPLAVARASSLALLAGAGVVAGGLRVPGRSDLGLTGLAGALDAAGNAFFVLAAQAGRLDAAAVLSSLYPASTVALAHVVLRERLGRFQTVGVLLALAAIACVAA
jgi:uncharacterized membrane protein